MGNDPASERPAGESRLKEIAGFEIISKLGQGGMGAVFKARQKSLDRIVALKILPKSIANDGHFIERFQREARASAKLNHPNIVQGINVGKDPATGLWYFAMEYIEGPSLRQLLEEKSVLPEAEALGYVRAVCRALELVHTNNMVHRDIKPDNILIGTDGEARLADLGLAKQLNDDVSLTQSGEAVGTPFYMAPEQVRGENKTCDIRTDLYALGATLYHLVTGKPPFNGPTGAVVMSKHLTDPAPKANKANPAVSDGCSKLIEKMMQKKPEQRQQTPVQVIQQIDKVLAGPEAAPQRTARPTGPRAPVIERKVQPRSSVPLYAGLGVATLGVIGFLAFGGSKSKPGTVAEAETKPARETPAAAPKPPPKADPSPLKANESSKAAPAPAPKPPEERPVAPAPETPRAAPQPERAAVEVKPPAPAATTTPPPKEIPAEQNAALEALLKKFDKALLEIRDVKAAGEFVAEGKRSAALKSANVVGAMAEVMAAFDEIARGEQDALAALAGQKVELETLNAGVLKGTVARALDGAIALKVDFGGGNVGERKVKVADLTEAQRKKLFPPVPPRNDAQRLAQTYTALAKGDYKSAFPLLDDAAAFALTPHCRSVAERIRDEKTKSSAELAAPGAWQELAAQAGAPKVSDADAKILFEKLERYSRDYGATPFAVTNKEKIDAARARIERILSPNLLANGDFEKGSWDGWEKKGGSLNTEISSDQPHGGKHAVQFTVQRNYFGSLAQVVTLEPQTEYRISCWVKHVRGPIDEGRGGVYVIEGNGERKEVEGRTLRLFEKCRIGEWVLAELKFTPTVPTVRIELWVRQTSKAVERYCIQVDDLELARSSH